MPQFRAKARAIDLLGKGQISDLPTAISELWKNGYDAYGDKLEAYLYVEGYEDVKHPFFVISDDGRGMSRQDILEKWIVLGTDSKTRNIADVKGEETLYKEPRIKMGEKGIGRLSVAYLGSPMLMLTRKVGYPLQALFVDWRILENYNLFIEDINIPLKAISSETDFSSEFDKLKNDFINNFKKKTDRPFDEKNLKEEWIEQKELAELIVSDINKIDLPSFFNEEFVRSLLDNTLETHGTKFIIFNPDEQLIVLSKSETKDIYPEYEATVIDIRTSLNGLFNVFKKENVSVKTKFVVLDNRGERDLISTLQFFTYEDFELADHLISGHFDENGEFTGELRIYNKDISHTFKPIRKPGKTLYGKFNIKLGTLPGRENESRLNAEQYKLLDEKVWNFGGLYIYRDGFRVLPYGRTEMDFLEFEKRRSKHAGYYFFSHRQLFGYIEITRENNKRLTDKAGREGFINNAAYREFKADLIAFFIDLARKYFGTGAESDLKEKLRSEVKEASENEKAEKEIEKDMRKQYVKNLKEYPQRLQEISQEYSDLLRQLSDKQNQSELIFEDIEQILKQIEACKGKIKRLELKKPIRFSLSENQQKTLFYYRKEYESLLAQQIDTSQKEIEKARKKLKDYDLLKEFDAKYKQYKGLISALFEEASDKTKQSVDRIKTKLEEEKKSVFIAELTQKYEAIRPTSYEREEILESLSLLENIYKDLIDKAHHRIDPFLNHIDRLNLEVDEEALTGYYKIKYEEIEKQWLQTKELAQMGIAVEIIDHQFNALYSQVATAITQIKDHLSDNRKAQTNYKSLKTAFEHLEDKYKLMSPLYRTTGKVRKNITGKDIKEYLILFFGAQLVDRDISLESSKEFDKTSFFTFESILLPAFVNVIHNAIYWLTSVEERKILLDLKDQSKVLILNSGEPIEDFYLSKIFKLFYSQKPNGRGIGLFLARETLLSVGYNMYATNDPAFNLLNGACFVIDSNPNEINNN